jgi:hypothetical protein
MNYPTSATLTPRDWHNYLVAQLVGASLGYLPRHALAVGVEPGDEEITVHFQLTEITPQDEDDMAEIVAELSILLGDVVGIRRVTDVRSRSRTDPLGPIRWTYRTRVDDELATDNTQDRSEPQLT